METAELMAKATQGDTKSVAQYLQEGEYVYEIYAILIHNGGAFGGHYFAYIKHGDNKWSDFNDSRVSEITFDEIAKTFGGDGQPNTAYMLLYRKVSGSQEIADVPQCYIDSNKVELQKAIKDAEAQKKRML